MQSETQGQVPMQELHSPATTGSQTAVATRLDRRNCGFPLVRWAFGFRDS